jgi:hypothetical protein
VLDDAALKSRKLVEGVVQRDAVLDGQGEGLRAQ